MVFWVRKCSKLEKELAYVKERLCYAILERNSFRQQNMMMKKRLKDKR